MKSYTLGEQSRRALNALERTLSGIIELPQWSKRYVRATLTSRLLGTSNRARFLQPLHEVAIDGADWRSVGTDPQLSLPVELGPYDAGYWMMEVHIDSEAYSGQAKVYLDYGHGPNEEDSIQVVFRSGRLAKRVIWLRARPHSIRLDPLETEGAFAVRTLRFVPLMKAFAQLRMLTKLGAQHQRFQGRSPWRIRESLRLDAENAFSPSATDLRKAYGDVAASPNTSANYLDWVRRVETPVFTDIDERAAQLISALRNRPIISILMPTFNTDARLLRECIESVRQQSYPHWQLCIADDASPSPHVRKILDDYAQHDERIRTVLRTKNGHICHATNSALEIATGQYVALLDHDDLLSRHALYFVSAAINQNPAGKVFYSDEDKITESGERKDPHFKSKWNPDLLLSQNYVSHLTVYEAGELHRTGNFRPGFEGSQDHDLLLRCTANLSCEQIVHIPQVLYHWRQTPTSTASSHTAKTYTNSSGLKAVHEAASAEDARVLTRPGILPNTYRVSWPIPENRPLASIIIPTRDTVDLLATCVNSVLAKTAYENYEILIVDNQSIEPRTHKYFESLVGSDRIRLLPYDHEFNYAAINNWAVSQSSGEIIVLLNNDIEVIEPSWLDEMIAHASRASIGCVGAKLLYPDGTVQHGGVITGIQGVAGHAHKHFSGNSPGYFGRLQLTHNMSAVTAACLAVRKGTYMEVGGLDEQLKVAFNDVDFCLRVRDAGYRNLWTPHARLYHHESVSRGTDTSGEKLVRFQEECAFMRKRWELTLRNDPYYSPNLTLLDEDLSIGFHNAPTMD